MATFNLTITYQDSDGPEVLAALQAYYATNGIPAPTLAQVRAYLQNDISAKVKNIVLAARQKAATTAVSPPLIT